MYTDENFLVEPTIRENIFTILELNLFQKYLTNPSKQSNLLKTVASTDPLKRNLIASIFSGLLSKVALSQDFNIENLNPTSETPTTMEIENKKENTLQINLFQDLQLKDKELMLHYCNEFYSHDSTLLQRDFLQNDFVLVIFPLSKKSSNSFPTDWSILFIAC